jgi:hypothetical protein
MKRLIKKSDAAILRQNDIFLDSSIAIEAIKNNVPNFKEIQQYDTAANSTAAIGFVGSDYEHIIEVYVYKDINDERWLASVIAPIKKIRDKSINSSDLKVTNTHIDTINLNEIMSFINNIKFTSKDGDPVTFNSEYSNNLKNIEQEKRSYE